MRARVAVRHHVMFGLLNDAAIAAHSAALPIPNGTYLPAYPCEYSRAPPAAVCEYKVTSLAYNPPRCITVRLVITPVAAPTHVCFTSRA